MTFNTTDHSISHLKILKMDKHIFNAKTIVVFQSDNGHNFF